jgi:hypothetical protein
MDTVITTAAPVALPVVDYDFKFAGEPVLQITMWLSLGDSVESTDEMYCFRFPRLGLEHCVLRTHLLSVSIRTTTRVPFDADEFKRKMNEVKKQHGKNQAS